MKFDWSDISIKRDYGEFGIVGAQDRIYLLTLSMDSGSIFVIGNFFRPDQFPLEQLDRIVVALEATAREIAASETCGRFLAEAEAYVRSRPDGCRSSYMTDDDPDFRADATDDIRRGLTLALKETDPYRAARAFESVVPYLIADIEIIDLMSPIIATFHGELENNLGPWVEKAGERQQAFVGRRPLMAAAVARFHEANHGVTQRNL